MEVKVKPMSDLCLSCGCEIPESDAKLYCGPGRGVLCEECAEDMGIDLEEWEETEA